MEYTGLICTSYPDPKRAGKAIIRLYYQAGKQIRESCFDDENGWYVRPSDDLVATNAKGRSPIAATNLNDGRKTSVFYLDDNNKLWRSTDNMVRGIVSYGDDGNWVATDAAIGDMLPGTSMCAISGSSQTRLFLQDKDGNVKDQTNSAYHRITDRIKPYKADSNAPITAIAWGYDTNHFEMRAFTL
ncbi:hypothetical protein B0T24DRAFT_681421 [Lasiosphaeria ovina]|uniref:Fucose-specific lectin n=1 Tax=Lasiosphaeria ovina TaxID=92902 RepID=A0AAE0K3S8_9PEZI|nr:hypothetical protein B0T24DRAFT_681421 [Lasiosphaeria ovina]